MERKGMGELVIAPTKVNTTFKRQFWKVLVCVACLGAMPAAHAFKLAPITMEFDPSGRGASRAFRVENESDEPVAVQISILSRAMALDGKELNAPADDDFTIYPPQILLKAKQVQTVRVKWIGTAKPEKEIAYRILAEQLPISLNKEQPSGGKINLVVRYLGSIYIVPKGAKPNIAIESVNPVSGPTGDRRLAIVFANQGKAHAILRDLKITLKSGGKTVELGTKDLDGVSGENILAGAKRRFVITWPSELPDGSVEASFDFHRQ